MKLFVNAKIPHFLVQQRAVNAKLSGRSLTISAIVPQGFGDQLAFQAGNLIVIIAITDLKG